MDCLRAVHILRNTIFDIFGPPPPPLLPFATLLPRNRADFLTKLVLEIYQKILFSSRSNSKIFRNVRSTSCSNFFVQLYENFFLFFFLSTGLKPILVQDENFAFFTPEMDSLTPKTLVSLIGDPPYHPPLPESFVGNPILASFT